MDREAWALTAGVAALVLVATAAATATAGRSKRDRAWYAAIRARVCLAPPASVFAPIWTVLVLAFAANVVLYANNATAEAAHNESYTAAFILFLAWVPLFALWTPLFFAWRAVWAALVNALLLFGVTLALLIVEATGGEDRWWVLYLLLLPQVVWLAFAVLLNFCVACVLAMDGDGGAPDGSEEEIAQVPSRTSTRSKQRGTD
jgi:tryptophan-rich sensory protein